MAKAKGKTRLYVRSAKSQTLHWRPDCRWYPRAKFRLRIPINRVPVLQRMSRPVGEPLLDERHIIANPIRQRGQQICRECQALQRRLGGPQWVSVP